LEEKGIHKTGDNHGAPENVDVDDDASGKASGSPAPKVSKIDKLKEKLHLKH
jgi:hypothetical protein